jgi:acetate---CoA ligase (ADP-forming) subunit beta
MAVLMEQNRVNSLMAKFELPIVKQNTANNADEAVKTAQKISFPVAMKIVSPDIIHKTEAGAIKVNIKNEQEAKDAYNEIIANCKKYNPKANIKGVLIQQMVSGQEVIVGMKKDAQFGPVLMVGLGGVLVELLKDVSFRITPVDKKMALEMLKELKGFKLLDGFRGSKKANLNALADIIEKTSQLALKTKEIEELDFNPVIVNDKNAFIVDARIMTK